MAKDNSTPATATAPKKERAEAGSSIPARAKAFIAALHVQLNERLSEFKDLALHDLMDEGTAEEFNALAAEITDSQNRGLPLTVKLEKVQKAIGEHWAKMPVQNGKAVPNKVWNEEANRLMNSQSRIERDIQNEKTEVTAREFFKERNVNVTKLNQADVLKKYKEVLAKEQEEAEAKAEAAKGNK